MLFAIHALDKPDSLEVREATRPTHLDYVGANFNAQYGGPLVDESGKMCGSLIVFEAESWDDAREIVGNDPYVGAGLFESSTLRAIKVTI